MDLRELPAATGDATTETAPRFIGSAYDSVEAKLETLKPVCELRRQERGDIRGCLTSPVNLGRNTATGAKL